jgi:energy-coupling factor transporter ATP-binding protein EcfA2
MPSGVTITSIEFYNFKALNHFSVKLQRMNVLVGPNNSGKSTILSSLRVLAEGIRQGRSKTPDRVLGPDGDTIGYRIPEKNLPISVENVHTDYEETDSKVIFRLSNRNVLQLFFPREGGCVLLTDAGGKPTRSAAEFRRNFPITIGIVPVLGPIEHEEQARDIETVRRGLATHRASSHFRNFWLHFPTGFDEFAQLVRDTWPGMDIQRPERTPMSSKLTMFATEERIDRELFWSGFGFQIWCQLLTHISRAAGDTLLVIDEPEIYLHPDVQRQLLGILRDAGPDVVLATHSTEMMGEADPSEILLVDKSRRSAQRLRDVVEVQAALDAMGSLQNITLTKLARNRKILFVEGDYDYRIIRRFAKQANYVGLATGNDLTIVESGGFGAWERVQSTAWGLNKMLSGGALQIAAVFDRDFFPQEELDHILGELRQDLDLAYIHSRKEIENYLLVPAVLERAFKKAITERQTRSGIELTVVKTIVEMLDQITRSLRNKIQAQYVSKRASYLGPRSPKDNSVITAETMEWFDVRWGDLNTRMEIVPGKEVLRILREQLQTLYSVNLTDAKIIDEFRRHEIPSDMLGLLQLLDRYRLGEALA